jgi:hypothetical protein
LEFECLRAYIVFNSLREDPQKTSRVILHLQSCVWLCVPRSYWALALGLYFKRGFPAARLAADRSIELNRMDGSTVPFMGALSAQMGEWDRGCAIAEPASALNLHHAGRHRYLRYFNAYRKRDYQEALAMALRLDMPGHFLDPASRAAVHGQLGQRELAHKAVQDLLLLRPDFATMARSFFERWQSRELVEHLIEGWRKAGLEIAGPGTDSPNGAISG